ncbi:hypothetical protein Gotur_033200 [Gossypium turneri]
MRLHSHQRGSESFPRIKKKYGVSEMTRSSNYSIAIMPGPSKKEVAGASLGEI